MKLQSSQSSVTHHQSTTYFTSLRLLIETSMSSMIMVPETSLYLDKFVLTESYSAWDYRDPVSTPSDTPPEVFWPWRNSPDPYKSYNALKKNFHACMLYIFVGVVNVMADHEQVRHENFFSDEADMIFLFSTSFNFSLYEYVTNRPT